MAAPRSRSVLTPGVEVRPSPIEGLGLFAARAFAAGEVVAVLGGRVVDDAGWAEAAASGPVSGYAIGEGRHLVQDANDRARFGNHSCDPTTWLVDEVTLVARRPVAAGEELTSDYATLTGDPAWALSCRSSSAAPVPPRPCSPASASTVIRSACRGARASPSGSPTPW